MATMMNRFGTKWEFGKFDSTLMAELKLSQEITDLWNKSRSVTDSTEKFSIENEAKGKGRSWRRYVVAAENGIDSDEYSLSEYEKMADVLSTIDEDKQPENHEELFSLVATYSKGWKDYSGNYRDAGKFGKLNQYLLFRELMSIYGPEFMPMFIKAGIL